MAATTMDITTNDIYNVEPKIYISTATLQLKVKTGDYVWHTEVLTPPETPSTQEMDIATKKQVNETNAAVIGGAATTAAVAGTAANAIRKQQMSTTATTQRSNKPISIVHAVTDFMSAERYHTENIENMNPFVTKV